MTAFNFPVSVLAQEKAEEFNFKLDDLKQYKSLELHERRGKMISFLEGVGQLTYKQKEIFCDTKRTEMTEKIEAIFEEAGLTHKEIYTLRGWYIHNEAAQFNAELDNTKTAIDFLEDLEAQADQQKEVTPDLTEEEEKEAERRLSQAQTEVNTVEGNTEKRELEKALSSLSERYEEVQKEAEQAKQEAQRLQAGKTLTASERLEKLGQLNTLSERMSEAKKRFAQFQEASTEQEVKVAFECSHGRFATANAEAVKAIKAIIHKGFTDYIEGLEKEIEAVTM